MIQVTLTLGDINTTVSAHVSEVFDALSALLWLGIWIDQKPKATPHDVLNLRRSQFHFRPKVEGANAKRDSRSNRPRSPGWILGRLAQIQVAWNTCEECRLDARRPAASLGDLGFMQMQNR